MTDREIIIAVVAAVAGLVVGMHLMAFAAQWLWRRERDELKLTVASYKTMVEHAIAVQGFTVRRADLAEREAAILRGDKS